MKGVAGNLDETDSPLDTKVIKASDQFVLVPILLIRTIYLVISSFGRGSGAASKRASWGTAFISQVSRERWYFEA